MSLFEVFLLVTTGWIAGFVNAVAGGGSAISLAVLESMLGASVANGTNRIAILLANATAVTGFSRGGAMPWRRALPLIPATLVGAVAGALTATRLSPGSMRRVFAFVLVFIAVSVVARPSAWLKERTQSRLHEPWRSLAFVAIGFYGGFVQAGVGFMLLAGLVLGGGLDLVRGNAAKVLLILIYTPVALLIFAGAAQVDLGVGLVLAIGNSTGAWMAARLAVRKGAGWIRWLLVVVAMVAALRMLFF